MAAVYKRAAPYKNDAMNLPVADVDKAIPFYETVMGFRLVERKDGPRKSAILSRDQISIGLAENGGDPTQEGCFFEVDDVEAALAEVKANGLEKDASSLEVQSFGQTSYRVFFVVAPDGLCYMLGERQSWPLTPL
jgi:catechol 2,3-dioxygenase-like lactoylglutathione lyase family enzyme